MNQRPEKLHFLTDFWRNNEIFGSILATFEHPKSEFWGFQEGIQERVDDEGVLVSILERFPKAWERQKRGFRMGGSYFFRISGVGR